MTGAQLHYIARRVRSSLVDLRWSHMLTAGTMAMTLFVFGAFMVLQSNLETLLNGWGEQIQINAYLDKDISGDASQVLAQRLQTYPEVQRTRLISQEQAWKEFRSALGSQAGILDGLPQDVLPPSIEIAVKPEFRGGAKIAAVAARIRNEKGVASVEYPQEWVDRLQLIILAVQWAKWILGSVLFCATLFIVGSTVKLALVARKDEIEIMQLVGAGAEMIQAPFVLEGMIQGVTGAVVALGCLWLLFYSLRDGVPVSVGLFGPFNSFKFLDLQGMLSILAVGWVLGSLGSLVSLRRFLRKW
jgi:cell division transport system permease protein